MKCEKKGNLVNRQVTVGQEDLEQINQLTRREFSQEELYCFRVVLCDNDVDRQMERFDEETLEQLARMFVGKTGICDHQPKTANQLARIYQAQVEYFPGKTNLLGEPYCAVVAKAYMVRTESNRDLILEIEAGIKKEVSVGCAMGRKVCSVCGEEYGTCGHRKGEHYDGTLCCAILKEPMDAYEFSFVAVPAQREAGVLKTAGRGVSLKELADRHGAQEEYRVLWQLAQLGKAYRKQMEDETVRLCLSLRLGPEEPVLRSLLSKASAEELTALKNGLEQRFSETYPVRTQLSGNRSKTGVESEYLI